MVLIFTDFPTGGGSQPCALLEICKYQSNLYPSELLSSVWLALDRKAFLFTNFVARNSKSNEARPLMLVTGEMNVAPNYTML